MKTWMEVGRRSPGWPRKAPQRRHRPCPPLPYLRCPPPPPLRSALRAPGRVPARSPPPALALRSLSELRGSSPVRDKKGPLFFSLLLSPPVPPLLSPSLEKEGARCGRCRVGRNGAGRAVLGTSSHVSPYVTYKMPISPMPRHPGRRQECLCPAPQLPPPAALPEPRGEGRATGYRFSSSIPPQPPPKTNPGLPRVLDSAAPKGSAT